jgi:hypothetical protein
MGRGQDVVCADCRFCNEMLAIERVARSCGQPYQFIFCDYRSPRYDALDPHPSEAMAQEFLQRGFKDGDIIIEDKKENR